MDLHPGVLVRDYRIVSLLGEGGMGEVWLAEETLLGRKVAVKRLNPKLTGDAQFSERFVNEARIQARLIHPNIVALYNFFIEVGIYYMIMEYAEGITLKELISKTGPIQEQRTRYIFGQVINALSHAHSKQIIHRDIKPSNIMIDEADSVKVMDFGIARLLSDKHLTRTGAKLGTLYYMSPEQIMAEKNIDHRTDIYSAGIVLYEMLTGRLPYNTNVDSDFIVMKEIMENPVPDPRDIYQFISGGMADLVTEMTHKDVKDRVNLSEIRQADDFLSEPESKVRSHQELNQSDKVGNSAYEELFWAASEGNASKLRSLLEIGVPVDIQDPDGWTALMYAADKGYTDCVRLLLEKGAKADIKAVNGETALDIAMSNHHDDVETQLRHQKAEAAKSENKDFSNYTIPAFIFVFFVLIVLAIRSCVQGY